MISKPDKIKSIIFDLDGTLLDTLDDLADSMNRVLYELGFPQHPTDAYRYFVGDGIDILARRVLPEDKKNEKQVQNCVKMMRQQYGSHWKDRSVPYPGIEEMLSALREKKIKINILSNKPDKLTQSMVSHFFSSWKFEEIRGAIDGVPKKPDPGGAILIAEKLELSSKEFLYVGDTNTDMETAQRAGMFAIGALWGFRTMQELQTSGAQALLEHPLDILHYL